ncbi:2-C-methyl-D-erythritol 2,4-cyclodiphosphate synthase [Patescibacteria group bacterium]|nr:2-C-methyl-D-erythritol 2,4-cyclodiphosphate synthase [Patescibacteria group bacterium]
MNYAILLASGKSNRFSGTNKLLQKINGKPIWQISLDLVFSHKLIDQVIMVCSDEIKSEIKDAKGVQIVLGGDSRYKSLINGLNLIKKNLKNDDIVVIHNAANPLATKKEISRVIRGAMKAGASAVGRRVIDTIKLVGQNKKIQKTLNRENLFAMQTPQAIKSEILLEGIQNIKFEPTDDLIIAENIGIKPILVIKSANNFKITTDQDLILARYLAKDMPQDFICGVGEDSHKFSKSEKGLTLAGITFPEYSKLQANSDGDVILHSIINAISSSMGGGSISLIADEMCQEGITDSAKYLEKVLNLVDKRYFSINNISISLECSEPKIEPIIPKLKSSLSKLTDIPEKRIGITATSGEELSSFGRGEGIKCMAMVSLIK